VTLDNSTEADPEPETEPDEIHPLLGPYSDVGQRLIQATIDVMDADGEVAVRVQDLVAAVGVQAPVLYRNFGSREGLVQAAQAIRLQRDMDAEVERFSSAVASANTAEQFTELLDALIAGVATPTRRAMRWKRVNVIGSTYSRPELAAAVAQLQRRTVARIAEAFRPAQQRGWIRADLDLAAFAAWFAGQTLGRILIELGDTDVDDETWNALSALAIRHLLLG